MTDLGAVSLTNIYGNQDDDTLLNVVNKVPNIVPKSSDLPTSTTHPGQELETVTEESVTDPSTVDITVKPEVRAPRDDNSEQVGEAGEPQMGESTESGIKESQDENLRKLEESDKPSLDEVTEPLPAPTIARFLAGAMLVTTLGTNERLNVPPEELNEPPGFDEIVGALPGFDLTYLSLNQIRGTVKTGGLAVFGGAAFASVEIAAVGDGTTGVVGAL